MVSRALVAAAGAALVVAGAALADAPILKLNAADQAKARAALVRAADLGTGWKGGAVKPEKPSSLACPALGYAPKASDLVVTGHAEADFEHQGLAVSHEVTVLQSAQMVRTDFARSVRPQLAKCLAQIFGQSSGPSQKVVSSKKVPFPRVGDVTAAYRIATDVTESGKTVRVLMDVVFFGTRRTEHTLTVIAPALVQAKLPGFEAGLARKAVARSRA